MKNYVLVSITLSLWILIYSCINKPQNEDYELTIKQEEQEVYKISFQQEMLEKATSKDTFEYSEFNKGIYFFKSGNIINDTAKHAVLFQPHTDSTHCLRLYEYDDEEWIFLDSVNNLRGGMAFHMELIDFNFDGNNDIYIINSASNGFVLLRGHLITFQPKSKKLKRHFEVEELANLKVNINKKRVTSEDWDCCDDQGYNFLWFYTYLWKDEYLVQINKEKISWESIDYVH